jgi:hypothetical protein
MTSFKREEKKRKERKVYKERKEKKRREKCISMHSLFSFSFSGHLKVSLTLLKISNIITITYD